MTALLSWDEITNLAHKAIEGDQAAYRDFLQQVSLYISKKIKRSVPQDFHDDLRQEVLLAVHKSLHTYEFDRPLQKWINALAHYKISDFFRAYYKDKENLEESLEDIEAPSFDQVDIKQTLNFYLRQVSNRDRVIILGVKYEGRPLKDLADELNLSEANVKVLCFRAMKRLRKIILKEEFGNG